MRFVPSRFPPKSWENCYVTVHDYRWRFTDPYNFEFGSGTQTSSTLIYAIIYKGQETSSDVNTFTNVIKRHCLQQTTGDYAKYLRHKLLCTYFRPRGICRIRFIMFNWDFGVVKRHDIKFNNRNLNFNPLSTKISNKKFRFIGTLSL